MNLYTHGSQMKLSWLWFSPSNTQLSLCQCRGGERQEGCLPAPGPRPLSAVARNQPHLAACLHLDQDDNNLHITAVRGPLVWGIWNHAQVIKDYQAIMKLSKNIYFNAVTLKIYLTPPTHHPSMTFKHGNWKVQLARCTVYLLTMGAWPPLCAQSRLKHEPEVCGVELSTKLQEVSQFPVKAPTRAFRLW